MCTAYLVVARCYATHLGGQDTSSWDLEFRELKRLIYITQNLQPERKKKKKHAVTTLRGTLKIH